MSQPQIFIILKIFKDFFACKIVLDANHHYPEFNQRLFRLQTCLRRKSSFFWKYSTTFSPAKLSYTQSIIILKIFKDSSPAKLSEPQITIILEIFKDFFACKIVSAANLHYPENIQRLLRLQNCLRRKSPLSWIYPKTFRLQNCLSGRSSLSWKDSKTSSPEKVSSTQIINILNLTKDFFSCKNVSAANLHYPENIQRLLRLQNCLRRKSPLSWIYPKTFRLQNCLSGRSSLSWKDSKTSSPEKVSSTQIINILNLTKDFFSCKNVLDANL